MGYGLNSPQVMGGQKLPRRPLSRALQEWRVLSLARSKEQGLDRAYGKISPCQIVQGG